MTPSPEEELERLSRGADDRRVASLKIIHGVCQRLRSDGQRMTRKIVGRMSKREGGPDARAIVNPSGAPYRILIDAHLSAAGVTKATRKPSKAAGDGLLDGIMNTAQRKRIELLREDVARLNGELKAVQHIANKTAIVTVAEAKGGADMPIAKAGQCASVDLLPFEREALTASLDPNRLASVGLTVDARGRVLFNGKAIFPAAFATALAKIAREFGSRDADVSPDLAESGPPPAARISSRRQVV
jgi:hypothetical protein